MAKRGAAAVRYDLAAARHAYHVALANEQGWRSAVALCQLLSAGASIPPLPMVSPEGENVFLHATFDCFGWYGTAVVPDRRPVVAFGPPPFVAAAVALADVANRRARRRAEVLSRPRWHSHGLVQVLVTATATWCGRGGQWRCYRHDTVAWYEVGHHDCTMRFSYDVPPVKLRGPAAWCHAVLFAHAQYGPAFLQAPYLERLRQMALAG